MVENPCEAVDPDAHIDWKGRAERWRIALDKINEIRNGIVGSQQVNWSEHIYPLVAALNDAGIVGLPYPEAKARFLTLFERAKKAEATLTELRHKHEHALADLRLFRAGRN